MDIYEESVELHKKLGGKLSVMPKMAIKDRHDLALAYTPGVAQPCKEIAKDKNKVYELTIKKNSVAVVSDGSAVLGLGNIGAEAAIPVMEGKALLFKEYGSIDAFPICITTQDSKELIHIIKNIAPVFGGINLEDISAPRCFEVEEALQDLGIPVFHDDQHGTAIVVLAALINACKVAGKKLSDLRVGINGAGAAGTAIAKMLLCAGHEKNSCTPVKEIIVCDSKGIISKDRLDIKINPAKAELAKLTNRNQVKGTLADAINGADVFIGVSVANILNEKMVKSMNKKSIIFAMANPVPEVMPDDAKKWGAFIVATGRSDFPNQVNNVLAFPGIFRGALDAKAKQITNKMKIAASYALSSYVKEPAVNNIIPSVLDKAVAKAVAEAVKKAAQ
ncbi:MAG: NADP-dependent malic enzyme [Nanoarchaeota archaeon]